MKLHCPYDYTLVTIRANGGDGNCPECGAYLKINFDAYRFGCSHVPRPLRGYYSINGSKISYEYCSMECKEEVELTLPKFKDLGLI